MPKGKAVKTVKMLTDGGKTVDVPVQKVKLKQSWGWKKKVRKIKGNK